MLGGCPVRSRDKLRHNAVSFSCYVSKEIIMKNIYICLIIFYLLIGVDTTSTGQQLKRSDFKVEYLEINEPMTSLLSKIGNPLKILEMDADKEYSYSNFTVWLNSKNRVSAFQIKDSTFLLHRGLRIGDSLKKIISLFGKSHDSNTLFERLGPYDYKFKDYSKYLIYEFDTGILDKECNTITNHIWYIVFYLKKDKLVRVLFYEGICE